MKRTWLGVVLGCFLLLLALPVHAAPGVEMKVQAAGGGRVRQGGWVTVLVDLTNQGGELSGDLVAGVENGPGPQSESEYVVPLTLPAGGKKRVPIDLPAIMGGGQVRVRLQSGGTTINEQMVDLMMMSPDTLFIGVLSDDELGMPALARLGVGDGGGLAPQVARLDGATFPSSAALLEAYDVIALSRFDTGSLSKEQLQALEAWVGRGGTLLVAGGPEWKRTFANLPAALAPVTISGVQNVETQPLSALSARPIAGQAAASDGTVAHGQVLAAAGQTPLVVLDRVGTGKVVYLAFDPTLEPLAGWTGQAEMLQRVLGAAAKSDQTFRGNTDGMMQSALQRLPGLGLPDTRVLGSLLGGYMLLVGPLSYWLLKRKDRRDLLWVTVPVLSLGFVAAVYGMGYGKQFSVVSSVITVTELSHGTPAASLTSYVGVYAPSRSQLAYNLGSTRLVRPLLVNFNPNEGASARITRGDRTTIALLNLNNYSMKSFAVDQDVSVKGGLELVNVSMDDAGILTAQVANKLDRRVRQVSAGGFQVWTAIGDLAPGQTSAPFTLNLAPTFGKGMRMPMGFSPTGPNADDDRRNMVLNAMFAWDGNKTAPGSVTITGWTDEPLVSPDLPDLGRATAGTNLVYTAASLPVDAASGNVPPGAVVGVRTGGPGFGRSPWGYSLPQGTTTFSLVLPPLDPARVAEVRLHVSTMDSAGQGYTLEIKNQRSGEWMKLTSDPVQPLTDWQSFVGPGGLMELRVDVNGHLELALPTVSVKGVAR